jgi:hypothetical protein
MRYCSFEGVTGGTKTRAPGFNEGELGMKLFLLASLFVMSVSAIGPGPCWIC